MFCKWLPVNLLYVLFIHHAESIVVKDDTSAARGNFTGDETMGGNWTDKIMAMKSAEADKSEDVSEIADDEWVSENNNVKIK